MPASVVTLVFNSKVRLLGISQRPSKVNVFDFFRVDVDMVEQAQEKVLFGIGVKVMGV